MTAQDLLFYSTNKISKPLNFFQAILEGLAPDRGLYMPESIPVISKEVIKDMHGLEYHQIAHLILEQFMEDPQQDLKQKCQDAYSFFPRLEAVSPSNHLLWLDTGPTASFKDFAAQMMSRLMGTKLDKDKKLLILTATSGDTGSAIARAFYQIPNINLVILFPISEVSDSQRKQMTTLGGNVDVIGIDGKFDDAQALVKRAFTDRALTKLNLTSANSINIARLLPQSVYYFWAYSRLIKNADAEIIFSIPSGNFGDMMGAILAWKMGLPIKKLIVATNANDEFPKFLQTGEYQKVEPSRKCISNAMNVGHPSNLARLIDIFGGAMDENGEVNIEPDLDKMRQLIYSCSVSDEQTRQTMQTVYKKHNIILDPHGAVGWFGMTKFLKENPLDADVKSVCLETANPAKFKEEVNKILGVTPPIPPSLANIDQADEHFLKMSSNYEDFAKYLLEHKLK